MEELANFKTKSFSMIDNYPKFKKFSIKGTKTYDGIVYYIVTGVIEKVFYYQEIRKALEPSVTVGKINDYYNL